MLSGGTILLLMALTLYVSEREATAAMLGVTSLVLGAMVIHASLSSGERQQRFTAVLVVALIAGLFISVMGKFAFAANVKRKNEPIAVSSSSSSSS